MSLEDDLAAALAEWGLPRPEPGTPISIGLPLPESGDAAAGGLEVQLGLSLSGDTFFLATAVGGVGSDAALSPLLMLLAETLGPERYHGACVAATPQRDLLMAVHHWVLPAISPEQFRELLMQHAEGAALLIERIDELAGFDLGLQSLLR
jgi:hypothetical protein